MEEEWKINSSSALGTIIIGDMNVHHLRWLRHSSRNSVEGDRLRSFCNQYGFQQLVSEPTREANTPDLVFTDIESVKCTVLPAISDHKCVRASWKLQVPQTEVIKRKVWTYAKADWEGLRACLAATDWQCLTELCPDDGAKYLTEYVLQAARQYIPQRQVHEQRSTHPWINNRVLESRCRRDSFGKRCERRMFQHLFGRVWKVRADREGCF